MVGVGLGLGPGVAAALKSLAGASASQSALTRSLLTFDGSSYATFAEITMPGDFDVTVKFTAWYNWFTLCLLGRSASNTDLLYLNSSNMLTLRINGIDVASGDVSSSWADGLGHTVRIRRISGAITLYFDGVSVATGTDTHSLHFSSIGIRNTVYQWRGVIFDVSIDNAGDVTAWGIDSGNTDTEAAAIGDNDLTFVNVDGGDWEAFTQEESGDLVGAEMQADDYAAGIGNWIPYANNVIINDAGALRFEQVDHSFGGHVRADSTGDLTADLVPWNRYRASCEARKTSSLNSRLRWGDSAYITSAEWMDIAACKIPSAATGNDMDFIDIGSGGYVWARNFSFRRVIEMAA